MHYSKAASLCFLFIVKQHQMAQEVLTRLKEHPDAWTRVDTILEYAKNVNTKYYALQILETVIKSRWKVLPRAQCEGAFILYIFCSGSICNGVK